MTDEHEFNLGMLEAMGLPVDIPDGPSVHSFHISCYPQHEPIVAIRYLLRKVHHDRLIDFMSAYGLVLLDEVSKNDREIKASPWFDSMFPTETDACALINDLMEKCADRKHHRIAHKGFRDRFLETRRELLHANDVNQNQGKEIGRLASLLKENNIEFEIDPELIGVDLASKDNDSYTTQMEECTRNGDGNE